MRYTSKKKGFGQSKPPYWHPRAALRNQNGTTYLNYYASWSLLLNKARGVTELPCKDTMSEISQRVALLSIQNTINDSGFMETPLLITDVRDLECSESRMNVLAWHYSQAMARLVYSITEPIEDVDPADQVEACVDRGEYQHPLSDTGGVIEGEGALNGYAVFCMLVNTIYGDGFNGGVFMDKPFDLLIACIHGSPTNTYFVSKSTLIHHVVNKTSVLDIYADHFDKGLQAIAKKQIG